MFLRAQVVGAGLAGLSAAVELARYGVNITLSEAGPRAGGRCRSYFDPQLGLTIDTVSYTHLDVYKRQAMGRGPAAGGTVLHGMHPRFSFGFLSRPGWHVERAGAGTIMSDPTISALQSGKDHTQENFPVASFLVRPDARGPVMAYYRFARAADDIADNPDVGSEEKLRLLDWMRGGLEGGEAGAGAEEAQELARVCRARGITPVSYTHLDVYKRQAAT